MPIIADLHLHSKYSRATSKNMDLFEIEKWAKIKGVDLITATDFTHPQWFNHLKENLIEANEGIYRLKNSDGKIKFILTTEISLIYTKNEKARRVHLVIFAPSLAVVEKINARLGAIGNLKADGRPILGLGAKELLKICLEIDERIMVIPAHAWTPWFSVFGSKSGFDSLAECFEELTPYIYAIETGLSSDPEMNWRLSALDKITLISNSDAHSGQMIGREANVFELKKLTYNEVVNAIKEKDNKKFLYTIEFFPEEGKYHLDGHRLCKISMLPEQTKKLKGICPTCNKPLTIGVLNRVDNLADQKKVINSQDKIPFKCLIPLMEIIAEANAVNRNSKKVQTTYLEYIAKGKNELNILIDLSEKELSGFMPDILVKGIIRMRKGEVKRVGGYDGEYGKIKVFTEKDIEKPQKSLF